MINEFKECILCHKSLALQEFHKNLNKDGRFNVCKKCHYSRNQARRKDPKFRERYLKYSKSNCMFRRYGITIEGYEGMVLRQQGKCLICGDTPNPDGPQQNRNLHIDHNHQTDEVRGLLCHLCNRGIGLFRERIDLLEKALLYLKKHS